MTHSMKKGKMLYDPMWGNACAKNRKFPPCNTMQQFQIMIIKHIQHCGKMYALMEKRNINVSVVYKHDYEN